MDTKNGKSSIVYFCTDFGERASSSNETNQKLIFSLLCLFS